MLYGGARGVDMRYITGVSGGRRWHAERTDRGVWRVEVDGVGSTFAATTGEIPTVVEEYVQLVGAVEASKDPAGLREAVRSWGNDWGNAPA